MWKYNGANVLLLIRDNKADDWSSLCRQYNVNPANFKVDTRATTLRNLLINASSEKFVGSFGNR